MNENQIQENLILYICSYLFILTNKVNFDELVVAFLHNRNDIELFKKKKKILNQTRKVIFSSKFNLISFVFDFYRTIER